MPSRTIAISLPTRRALRRSNARGGEPRHSVDRRVGRVAAGDRGGVAGGRSGRGRPHAARAPAIDPPLPQAGTIRPGARADCCPSYCRNPEPRIGPLACTVAESLGFPATQVVERTKRNRLSDLEVIGGLLSPACYIEHSLPAVLYLAAPHYSNDFEAALVANTNVGGDNCRAAQCWASYGTALGYQAIPEQDPGLRSREELEEEIESFLAKCQP